MVAIRNWGLHKEKVAGPHCRMKGLNEAHRNILSQNLFQIKVVVTQRREKKMARYVGKWES